MNQLPTPYWVSDCGLHTLYCGDCFAILPHLSGVDAVVTDPPYGINAGMMNLGSYRTSRMKKTAWDKVAPELTSLLRLRVPSVIWGGNYFALPPSRMYLVWNKGACFVGRDWGECEMAWCSMDGSARVLTHDPLAMRDHFFKEHPTQKPVKVMLWSLGFVEGCTVLDPFTGSGSTGVACAMTGRKFIGIEIDEGYCAIAKRRIMEAANHLFVTPPTKVPEALPCMFEAAR